MSRSTLKRLGIAILCGSVGLALDIWRQGSSAPLLLGRIVTLPVAILFGPWYGALAAFLHAVAGRGIFAVGMRLLPLEAIVIGFFARRGRSPMLGGLIVWTTVAALNQHVGAYVGDHEHAVQSLAAGVAVLPQDRERQRLLAQYHEVYPGFV